MTTTKKYTLIAASAALNGVGGPGILVYRKKDTQRLYGKMVYDLTESATDKEIDDNMFDADSFECLDFAVDLTTFKLLTGNEAFEVEYKIYHDTGSGKYYLFTFGKNGKINFGKSYTDPDDLAVDIAELGNGDIPVTDWGSLDVISNPAKFFTTIDPAKHPEVIAL